MYARNSVKSISTVPFQALNQQNVFRMGCIRNQWKRPLSSSSVAVDCFETLGVKRSFDVAQDDLKSKYKKLMGEYHPDRHTLKSQSEQDEASQQAAKISRSYEVLSDNHERSLHLLALGGNPMEDDVSGEILDQAFLMEIMELREEVDDAKDEEELKVLQLRNKKRIDKTCQQLSDAFGQKDLDEAKRLTAMLQYWKRIDELITEKS